MAILDVRILKLTAEHIEGRCVQWEDFPLPGNIVEFKTVSGAAFYVQIEEVLTDPDNPNEVRLVMTPILGNPSLPVTATRSLTHLEFFQHTHPVADAKVPFNYKGLMFDLSESGQVVYIRPDESGLYLTVLKQFMDCGYPVLMLDPVGVQPGDSGLRHVRMGQEVRLSIQDIGVNRFIEWVISGMPESSQAKASEFLLSLVPPTADFIPFKYFTEHPSLKDHPLASALLHQLYAFHKYKLFASKPEEALVIEKLTGSVQLDFSGLPGDMLSHMLDVILRMTLASHFSQETQIALIAPEIEPQEVQHFIHLTTHRVMLIGHNHAHWEADITDKWYHHRVAGKEGVQIVGQVTQEMPLFIPYDETVIAPAADYAVHAPLIEGSVATEARPIQDTASNLAFVTPDAGGTLHVDPITVLEPDHPAQTDEAHATMTPSPVEDSVGSAMASPPSDGIAAHPPLETEAEEPAAADMSEDDWLNTMERELGVTSADLDDVVDPDWMPPVDNKIELDNSMAVAPAQDLDLDLPDAPAEDQSAADFLAETVEAESEEDSLILEKTGFTLQPLDDVGGMFDKGDLPPGETTEDDDDLAATRASLEALLAEAKETGAEAPLLAETEGEGQAFYVADLDMPADEATSEADPLAQLLGGDLPEIDVPVTAQSSEEPDILAELQAEPIEAPSKEEEDPLAALLGGSADLDTAEEAVAPELDLNFGEEEEVDPLAALFGDAPAPKETAGEADSLDALLADAQGQVEPQSPELEMTAPALEDDPLAQMLAEAAKEEAQKPTEEDFSRLEEGLLGFSEPNDDSMDVLEQFSQMRDSGELDSPKEQPGHQEEVADDLLANLFGDNEPPQATDESAEDDFLSSLSDEAQPPLDTAPEAVETPEIAPPVESPEAAEGEKTDVDDFLDNLFGSEDEKPEEGVSDKATAVEDDDFIDDLFRSEHSAFIDPIAELEEMEKIDEPAAQTDAADSPEATDTTEEEWQRPTELDDLENYAIRGDSDIGDLLQKEDSEGSSHTSADEDDSFDMEDFELAYDMSPDDEAGSALMGPGDDLAIEYSHKKEAYSEEGNTWALAEDVHHLDIDEDDTTVKVFMEGDNTGNALGNSAEDLTLSTSELFGVGGHAAIGQDIDFLPDASDQLWEMDFSDMGGMDLAEESTGFYRLLEKEIPDITKGIAPIAIMPTEGTLEFSGTLEILDGEEKDLFGSLAPDLVETVHEKQLDSEEQNLELEAETIVGTQKVFERIYVEGESDDPLDYLQHLGGDTETIDIEKPRPAARAEDVIFELVDDSEPIKLDGGSVIEVPRYAMETTESSHQRKTSGGSGEWGMKLAKQNEGDLDVDDSFNFGEDDELLNLLQDIPDANKPESEKDFMAQFDNIPSLDEGSLIDEETPDFLNDDQPGESAEGDTPEASETSGVGQGVSGNSETFDASTGVKRLNVTDNVISVENAFADLASQLETGEEVNNEPEENMAFLGEIKHEHDALETDFDMDILAELAQGEAPQAETLAPAAGNTDEIDEEDLISAASQVSLDESNADRDSAEDDFFSQLMGGGDEDSGEEDTTPTKVDYVPSPEESSAEDDFFSSLTGDAPEAAAQASPQAGSTEDDFLSELAGGGDEADALGGLSAEGPTQPQSSAEDDFFSELSGGAEEDFLTELSGGDSAEDDFLSSLGTAAETPAEATGEEALPGIALGTNAPSHEEADAAILADSDVMGLEMDSNLDFLDKMQTEALPLHDTAELAEHIDAETSVMTESPAAGTMETEPMGVEEMGSTLEAELDIALDDVLEDDDIALDFGDLGLEDAVAELPEALPVAEAAIADAPTTAEAIPLDDDGFDLDIGLEDLHVDALDDTDDLDIDLSLDLEDVPAPRIEPEPVAEVEETLSLSFDMDDPQSPEPTMDDDFDDPAPLAGMALPIRPSAQENKLAAYKTGEKVLHKRYGNGVIKRVIPMDDEQVILNVMFESVGKRLLDPKLTELEKVG